MRKSVFRTVPFAAATLALACSVTSHSVTAEVDELLIDSKSATIDCGGKDVNVISTKGKLKFTGRCKGIYFIGEGTSATVQSATLIQLSGDGMNVTVADPVTEAFVIGKNGRLTVSTIDELRINGDLADIRAQSIRAISAAGNDNRVTWRKGSPQINDIGSRNIFGPAK